MSVPESDEPIEMSCRETGSWAALRRPGREYPIDSIEGRWTLQILLCLNAGEHRFSDLRAAIPRISANILTDRLRALESAGLIERHHLRPPYASQVYMLADFATGLRPALDALASWRAETRDASLPAQSTGFDRGRGMEQLR
jgi:DNA-binding HxlR family transcriptional regulator